MKIKIISCDILTHKVMQEERITLDVEFQLLNSEEAFSKIWVELIYKGETVIKDAEFLNNSERIFESNKIHKQQFEIIPPFNAPDGVYNLCVGSDVLSREEYVTLGEIQVGNEVKETKPYSVEISKINIPPVLEKNRTSQVSFNVTFLEPINFETTAYLTLWKDGLLYDVIESEINITSESSNVEFEVALTNDLPEEEYEVKIGIHKVKSENSEIRTVHTKGADLIRSKYHKPMSYGDYFVKSSGKEHFWYINQFGAMIWDGEPYIPFGGMFVPKYLRQYDANNPKVNKANFEQDKADLDEIRAAGITDLYIGANIMLVTPTWAYKYFLDYLEKTGWRYGIQGDTRKNRRGSVFYPRATKSSNQFKVDNIIKSGPVSLTIDSKFARDFIHEKNVVYIVIDDENGEMVQSGISEMSRSKDGNLLMHVDVELKNENKHTVYFAPEIFQDLRSASNYWDDPEKTYDFIDSVFSKLESGDNLRFIVDLLNNESGIFNHLEQGRFSDENFNYLFSKWLENKYKSINELNNVWKTKPEVLNFEEAAMLIPVYTSNKDENNDSYSYYVNMDNGIGYKVDTHFGVSWNDYLDARDELFLDFMNKSSDTAKKHLDVPQIYKHVSVQRKYYINKKLVGGFDGLGSEAYEGINTVSNQFAITSAQNNQFARTAWNLVTETNNHENIMDKYESGQWSYVSKEDMHLRFNKALELGMKGIFDFLLADRPDIDGKLGMAYSWIINKHVIEWAKEYKEILHNPEHVNELVSRKYKDEVFYYYPPNSNWWMKPNERSCVQLTDDCYPFKRLKTEKGVHILSTEDLSVDTRLIFINLNDGPYSKVYGPKLSDFINQNHKDKRICILGHRNDLGTIPQIDKYYTLEKVSINNGNEVVQILKLTETSEILRTTSDDKPWALKDGNIYIVATDSFETSNGDFGTLHYVDDLGITDFE